jgi:hypothetical protein
LAPVGFNPNSIVVVPSMVETEVLPGAAPQHGFGSVRLLELVTVTAALAIEAVASAAAPTAV